MIDHRTVTPEVAGSSPVAPVSKCLQITKSAITEQCRVWSSLVTVLGAVREGVIEPICRDFLRNERRCMTSTSSRSGLKPREVGTRRYGLADRISRFVFRGLARRGSLQTS
jgi:hypothetical protein